MLSRKSPDADRRALARLDEHQSAILAQLAGAEAMLTDPVRHDVAGLARTRWTVMRLLMAYQLFKHREIFDPAIAGRVLGDARRAERMKLACTTIGDAFRAWVQRWSGSDVAAAWDSYQPAALGMIARLRTHIAQERAEVAALFASA